MEVFSQLEAGKTDTMSVSLEKVWKQKGSPTGQQYKGNPEIVITGLSRNLKQQIPNGDKTRKQKIHKMGQNTGQAIRRIKGKHITIWQRNMGNRGVYTQPFKSLWSPRQFLVFHKNSHFYSSNELQNG